MEALVVIGFTIVAFISAYVAQYLLLQQLTAAARCGLEVPYRVGKRAYYILTEVQYQRLYGSYVRELERAVGRKN